MSPAEKLYDPNIKTLPATERLALATLYGQNIVPDSVVDESDAWSEGDLQDFSRVPEAWQSSSGISGVPKELS